MAHKYCENPFSCDICMDRINGLKLRKLAPYDQVKAAEPRVTVKEVNGTCMLVNITDATGQYKLISTLSYAEFEALYVAMQRAFDKTFTVQDPGVGQPIPQEIWDLIAADPNKE